MYKDFTKHDFFCCNDVFLFFSMVSCIVFGGYDVFLFTVLFLNFVFVGDDVFLFKGWFLVLCLAAMMTPCLRDGFSSCY